MSRRLRQGKFVPPNSTRAAPAASASSPSQSKVRQSSTKAKSRTVAQTHRQAQLSAMGLTSVMAKAADPAPVVPMASNGNNVAGSGNVNTSVTTVSGNQLATDYLFATLSAPTVGSPFPVQIANPTFMGSVVFDQKAIITGLSASAGSTLINAQPISTAPSDGQIIIHTNLTGQEPQLVLCSLGGIFTPSYNVLQTELSFSVNAGTPLNVTSLTITGATTITGDTTVQVPLGTYPVPTQTLGTLSVTGNLDFGGVPRILGANFFNYLSPATTAGQLLVGTGLRATTTVANVVALGPSATDQAVGNVLISDLTQPYNVRFGSLASIVNANVGSLIPSTIVSSVGDLLVSTGSAPNYWTSLTLPAAPTAPASPIYLQNGQIVDTPSQYGLRFGAASNIAVLLSSATSEIDTQSSVSFSGAGNIYAPNLRIGTKLTIPTTLSVQSKNNIIPAFSAANTPSFSSSGTLNFPLNRSSMSQTITSASNEVQLAFVTSQIVKAQFSISMNLSTGVPLPFDTGLRIPAGMIPVGATSIRYSSGYADGVHFPYVCPYPYPNNGQSGPGLVDIVISQIPGQTTATVSVQLVQGVWGPNAIGVTQSLELATTVYWFVTAPLIPATLTTTNYTSTFSKYPFYDNAPIAVSGHGDMIAVLSGTSGSTPYQVSLFQPDATQANGYVAQAAITVSQDLKYPGTVVFDDDGGCLAFSDLEYQTSANNTGTVFTYTYSSGSWVAGSVLSVNNSASTTNPPQFGYSLAYGRDPVTSASGAILAVGSPAYTNGSIGGQVYVYRNGTLNTTLNYPGSGLTLFGGSVAVSLDGKKVATTVVFNGGGFMLITATWNGSGYTIAPGSAINLFFSYASGQSITCNSDGSIICVGSTGFGFNVIRGTSVTQLISGVSGLEFFGNSVSMTRDGSTLIVYGQFGPHGYTGVAVYRSQGGAYQFVNTMSTGRNTDSVTMAYAGIASMTGSTIVAGALTGVSPTNNSFAIGAWST